MKFASDNLKRVEAVLIAICPECQVGAPERRWFPDHSEREPSRIQLATQKKRALAFPGPVKFSQSVACVKDETRDVLDAKRLVIWPGAAKRQSAHLQCSSVYHGPLLWGRRLSRFPDLVELAPDRDPTNPTPSEPAPTSRNVKRFCASCAGRQRAKGRKGLGLGGICSWIRADLAAAPRVQVSPLGPVSGGSSRGD